MSKLWAGTVAIWVVGLIAGPAVVGLPVSVYFMWPHAEMRPFAVFIGLIFIAAFAWFIAALLIGSMHKGRARAAALIVPCAMITIPLALLICAPLLKLSVRVDLPPASTAQR